MDNTEIRCAGDDDMPMLAALQWRWRVEEWTQDPALDRDAFSAAFCEWVASRRGSHTSFVAIREGRAVGMAWIATVERTPTPSAMTRRYGHVQSVYVLPEERNHQVGSALLQRVKEEGDGSALTISSCTRAPNLCSTGAGTDSSRAANSLHSRLCHGDVVT